MAPADHEELIFYPAFCFKASPTHFAWVKMAAADVHKLRRRVEFGDESTLFYLNHPIRFVSVVGIIVSRTEYPRLTILTLDDSSGATIDVVVHKAQQSKTVAEAPSGAQQAQPHQQQQASNQNPPGTNIQTQGAQHVAASNRTADVDITNLEPGTVAQVKGTLSTFRGIVQLNLERVSLVRETSAEMRFLDQRCRYLVEVLSVPWGLTGAEVAGLRAEADEEEERVEGEEERVRRRGRRREEREERDRGKIWRRWEREERLREKEAEYCREAGVRVTREIERRKRGVR